MAGLDKKTFKLKNGTEIDGGTGIGLWQLLQNLHDREPDVLNALLALAEGRGDEVTPAHRATLRQKLLVRADRTTVVEPVKQILLSAAHHSSEGLVLTNPFIVPTEEVAQALGQARVNHLGHIHRLLCDGGADTGRDAGPG